MMIKTLLSTGLAEHIDSKTQHAIIVAASYGIFVVFVVEDCNSKFNNCSHF